MPKIQLKKAAIKQIKTYTDTGMNTFHFHPHLQTATTRITLTIRNKIERMPTLASFIDFCKIRC
jgi:hypothetical protein